MGKFKSMTASSSDDSSSAQVRQSLSGVIQGVVLAKRSSNKVVAKTSTPNGKLGKAKMMKQALSEQTQRHDDMVGALRKQVDHQTDQLKELSQACEFLKAGLEAV